LVNHAGDIDVFSLYTRSTIVLLTYYIIKPFSGWVKVYSYTVLCTIVYHDDDADDAGLSSGAGTNLRVEGTCQAPSAGIFSCAPPLCGITSSLQLVVLVSAFVVVSKISTLSCFLFFYTRCPLCPVICALRTRRHFRATVSHQKAW